MNTLKVGVLIVALTGLLIFFGNLLGGMTGAIIAFSLAMVLNFVSFWYSDKLVLSMTRAQPVTRAQAPEIYDMVERMARNADIPTPKVYVVNDPQPNAFATGRSPAHAAVAVNTGLVDILGAKEVEGVIAHEIAHIKHRDTLTMAIVATIAGAIMMLATFARFAAIFGGGHSDEEGGSNILVLLLLAIIAPLAAMMIQMGVSRAREYEADAMGAKLAGSPVGLAGALQKLERGAQAIPNHHMPPQAAHMCIVNPLRGQAFANLFSTHPPIEERVKRLMAMEQQAA
jgi:heat shock protein HtpX